MNELSMPVGPIQAPGPAEAAMLAGRAQSASAAEAEKVAKDFESVLLHKLMETMQRSVPESGLLDSGITKQVQGIFWLHMAQEVSSQGGMGLWKDIYSRIPGGQVEPPVTEQAL